VTRSAIWAHARRASAPMVALAISALLAWGVLSAAAGPHPATAVLTAASAVDSACQPLPTSVTPSPSTSPASSPSATVEAPSSAPTPVELCVSVQNSGSSVEPGHAVSFTVQVSAENGPVSGVSVTLSSAEPGLEPVFTGRCPGGDGAATCTVGSLATPVAPQSYQMQAQVTIASSAASGTSVTLTATADAATSPPMATMPAATGSVTVGAAPASATPSPSPSRTPDPTAPTTAAAAAPTVGPMPATFTSSSVISPGNLESVLPEISPTSDPTVGGTPSSAADVQPDAGTKTAQPTAGNFALVMPAETAEVLGVIIVALIVSLAATRLVATGHLSLLGRPNSRRRENGTPATKRPTHRRIRASAGLRWRRQRPEPRAGPSPDGNER
jgi:hypothetical protein